MSTPISHAHRAAWLLAAALVSCSSSKKAAAPPPAPPAKPTAAEESQKAFQLAAQSQKELADQVKKAEAAHAATVTAQQQLAKAEAQEQEERAKVLQLQERANQQLQVGVRQAQQAQAGAGGAGAYEGMQTVAGTVAQTSQNQVVLKTQGGRAMTFGVDSRTRILVGSEVRGIRDIQRGADAQVAYDPTKAGEMTALIIRVTPAVGSGTGGATSPQGSGEQTPQH